MVAGLVVSQNLVSAVDALGDGLDILEQLHAIGIDRREVGDAALNNFDSTSGQTLPSPVPNAATEPRLRRGWHNSQLTT